MQKSGSSGKRPAVEFQVRQAGTWDTSPECVHLDKCFREQQNTKKL